MQMISRLDPDGLLPRAISRFNRSVRFRSPSIDEFALIIGAMKCGTTTLYEYLTQHPNIYGNLVQKEPEYFSQTALPENLSGYLRQWRLPRSGRALALEASTGYTKIPNFPNVAERLLRLDAKMNFIYLVRDPIARIESHIAHNIANGVSQLEYEIEDLQHHIAVSSYAQQIEPYRTAFPERPILILDLDDLARDPARVVQDVYRHLDLEPHDVEVIPPKNTRSKQGQAAKYRLPNALKAELQVRLSAEMAKFSESGNFDVSKWGF